MQTAKADPSLLQSARQTEGGDRFNRTLFAAVDALEQQHIDYALIGGVASSGLGRPRGTRDIDIFVRPEDAGVSLEALGRHGFRTEKTDVNWLFKAFKEEILVDIIFKSRGEIYFDNEMADRSRRIEFHGRKVRAVAPEDLIIIKCAVHDEIGPHHWHDALAVLSHAEVDWPYLLKRGRRASRRLLALLTYAQSSDIWVPNWVIFELFRLNYGEKQQDEKSQAREPWAPPSVPTQQQVQRPEGIQRAPSSQYVAARVREAMARDPRGGDQDIKILVEGNRLLLRGEVTSDEHRRALEAVARDAAGGYRVESQLKVAVLSRPEGAEEVG